MKIKNIIIFLMIIFDLNLLAETDLSKYFLNENNFGVFQKGIKNGMKEKFYENGAIKAREFYIDNRKAGLWQFFYENGSLRAEIFFSTAFPSEIGIAKNYDENGAIVSEGKIENDEKVDLWNYYDENGKKVYSYNYSNGTISSYDEAGKEILKVNEYALARKLTEIQQEIKDDRIKSIEEKNWWDRWWVT